MNKLVWIDDLRNPFLGNWIKDYSPISIKNLDIIWVKSFRDFKEYLDKNGLPNAICFDHDLGYNGPEPEENGMTCARYLVDYCMDNNLKLPEYNIQSSNTVGADNIRHLLENFKRLVQ